VYVLYSNHLEYRYNLRLTLYNDAKEDARLSWSIAEPSMKGSLQLVDRSTPSTFVCIPGRRITYDVEFTSRRILDKSAIQKAIKITVGDSSGRSDLLVNGKDEAFVALESPDVDEELFGVFEQAPPQSIVISSSGMHFLYFHL